LKEAAEVLPEGHWVHSTVLSDFDACKEWGIRPSAVGLCFPEEDLTYMIEFLDTRRTMAAIDDFLQAEEMKEQQKKAARRGKR
jgi:hypothetical protein